MRVKLTVEYDVEPERSGLQPKEEANIVGMLNRLTRTRLSSFIGSSFGGQKVKTGWEINVRGVKVEPVGKMQ